MKGMFPNIPEAKDEKDDIQLSDEWLAICTQSRVLGDYKNAAQMSKERKRISKIAINRTYNKNPLKFKFV